MKINAKSIAGAVLWKIKQSLSLIRSAFLMARHYPNFNSTYGEIKNKAKTSNSPSRRIICIISTYNDADIIAGIIEENIKQGFQIYIIDNWSSDGTWEIIEDLNSSTDNIIGIERFPAEGRSESYDWHAILNRKSQIGAQFPGNWIFHQDSDEVTISLFNDISVIDFLDFVEEKNCNVVCLRMLDFRPTDHSFTTGNPVRHFTHYEFSKDPSYLVQEKIWLQYDSEAVDLASSGGHRVTFPKKRIYSIKLPRLHYSIRSISQLKGKILDRNTRGRKEREQRNWHTHIQGLENVKFIHNKFELVEFDQKNLRKIVKEFVI